MKANEYFYKEIVGVLTEVVRAWDDVPNWERQEKALSAAKKLLDQIKDSV